MSRHALPTSMLRASAAVGVPAALVLTAWGTGAVGSLGLYAPTAEYGADPAPAAAPAGSPMSAAPSVAAPPVVTTRLAGAPRSLAPDTEAATDTAADTGPTADAEPVTGPVSSSRTGGPTDRHPSSPARAVAAAPSMMSFGAPAPRPVTTRVAVAHHAAPVSRAATPASHVVPRAVTPERQQASAPVTVSGLGSSLDVTVLSFA